MKSKIKILLENNLLLRPALWAAFIYYGERNLITKKRGTEKILTEVEKSQLKNSSLWNEVDGDNTLRLNYALNENSIIFDVGGFEGNWSAEISARYNPSILIFEPYISYYKKIELRFKHNKKIKAFPFGLGSKTGDILFYGGGDWSSIFKRTDVNPDGNGDNVVLIMDIIEFIEKENCSRVDLIKINIEGGEFDLLERLIEKEYLSRFVNLQIQFHNIDPNSENRMRLIQKELGKTHKITYQYEFLWENWKKID